MSDTPGVGGRIPWPHAVRDSLVLVLTLALWFLNINSGGSGTLWAWSTAVGAGVFTAISGYLFHEWGHLVGAIAAGATIRLPRSPWEIFLFNFDVDRNDARQFLVMSIGGYVASVSALVVLAVLLPLGSPAGIIAMILVAGGVVATAILELPPFVRVVRGGALPKEGVAYVSDANRQDVR